VTTFHRLEEKLAAPFGLCNSQSLLAVAQEFKLSPSGDALLKPIDMLAVEVANIQVGVCYRREDRWCKLRAWRFVEVNDLISCDVYTQPLSL